MHLFCEIVGLVLLSLVCCFLDKDALLFFLAFVTAGAFSSPPDALIVSPISSPRGRCDRNPNDTSTEYPTSMRCKLRINYCSGKKNSESKHDELVQRLRGLDEPRSDDMKNSNRKVFVRSV